MGSKRSIATRTACKTQPPVIKRSITTEPINGIAGTNNTANGFDALFHNSNGSNNTATGAFALALSTVGAQNTAIGVNALEHNTTGRFNTALGYEAGGVVTTASNVICIGAVGNNVDNSCYIGQIFGATSSNGVAVFINSNGRLGTADLLPAV